MTGRPPLWLRVANDVIGRVVAVRRDADDTPLAALPRARRVEVTVGETGWWIPADARTGQPVVVLAHGFGARAADLAPIVRNLAARGLAMLLPEAASLPRFGPDGRPPEPPTRALARATDAARGLAGTPRVVLVGHSLGGSAAYGVAAADPDVVAVVSLGAVADPATTRMSIIPAGLNRAALRVVRDRLGGADLSAEVGTNALARRPGLRALVVHARDDRVVPVANAERLARAGTATRLRLLPHGRHDPNRLFAQVADDVDALLDHIDVHDGDAEPAA